MRANSFPDNALAATQMRETGAKSGQVIETTAIASDRVRENSRKTEEQPRVSEANSSLDNYMQPVEMCATNSGSHKILALNDLRGSEAAESDRKSKKNSRSLIAPSTLVRWCMFNLVGGIGIVVQFAALFLLKSVLHVQYLAATAIAVEAAVVHNFVWHERFTWADRTRFDLTKLDRTKLDRTRADRTQPERIHSRGRRSLTRLLRFNLTTGAVSMLGNLALMRVMVGQGHMNYLLANAIAIILCSLANFLVSEAWVFGKSRRVG